MLEIRRNYYLSALSLGDVLAMVVSFLVAGIRTNFFATISVMSDNDFRAIYYFLLVIILLLMYNYHLALSKYFNGGPSEVQVRTFQMRIEDGLFMVVLDFIVLISAFIISKKFFLSWEFIFTYCTIYLSLSLLLIFLISKFLCRINNSQLNKRNVLIVGSNKRAVAFAEYLESSNCLGLSIRGFVDNEDYSEGKARLVGKISDLGTLIRENIVDDIIINLPIRSHYDTIMEIIKISELHGLTVHYLTDIFESEKSSIISSRIGSISSIILHTAPLQDWHLVVKRLIDLFGSLFLLVVLSPLLLLVGVFIFIVSPGPVFFTQVRVGYNKRRFRIIKFRTMVTNAEALQKELETRNEMDGPVFKIAKDPRIIPVVGRFLRKYSLDELPQLINVFKGDMSLVGPRPLPLRDYENFSEDWIRRRFSVRPGITCYWQIGGRNQVSFQEWVEDDLRYVDNWGLWEDIKILFKTAIYVFKGKGV